MKHPTTDGDLPEGKRLSRGLSVLWEEVLASDDGEPMFDLVIVGSGYGGSAAAARLAGSQVPTACGGWRPARVCLLERGREYLPGDFPSRFGDVPRHVRIADQNKGRVRSNHDGLFDLRLGDDVAALVANGLGGGSLINAGVLLPPRPDDFPAGPWRDRIGSLAYQRKFEVAQYMLGGRTRRGELNTIGRHADGAPPKTKRLQDLALGARPCKQMPISVSMRGERNSAAVRLTACIQCGDCMTGCNVGAKDSLDVNLLRMAARRERFEVYTGASVLSLRRGPNADDAKNRKDPGKAPAEPHWVLHVMHTEPRLQAREVWTLLLRTRKVILAAGTLGSPEILLRSRTDELVFSPRLGEGFSCNGDNIAAVHRMAKEVNGCAEETQPLQGRGVGPTITAAIEMAAGVHRPFLVQEFAVPAPLKRLFDESVTTAHVLAAMPLEDGTTHGSEPPGTIDPAAVDEAAMKHTLLVGVIGHDDAKGLLHLPQVVPPADRPAQQGVLRIHWPDARHACELNASHDAVRSLTECLGKGASLVANPMWRLLPEPLERLVSQPRGPVLTVHPLGGCRIDADETSGVVDAFGRVYNLFQRNTKDDWFGSLAVLDGSIVPGSLGVNPALTIATLSLDGARRLRRDWGWRPPVAVEAKQEERPFAPPPPHPVPGAKPGETKIEVIERLSGPVRLLVGSFPETFHVELTVAYSPKTIRELTSTLERRINVDPASKYSRLRLYRQADWDEHKLRVISDELRRPHVLFEAGLTGSLRFLHREQSTPCRRSRRALWAWIRNRGLRDTWQEIADKQAPAEARPDCAGASRPKPRGGGGILKSLPERWAELKALSSHAGEVRRFDYALEVGAVITNKLDRAIKPGDMIGGDKRLTYNRRANPWHQLTRLSLRKFPAMRDTTAPVLTLDPRFLANQRIPLLRVAAQADQANALADLGSFALYMTRLLATIHLWTFRKPDRSDLPEPLRLPDTIEGLPAPRITELEVDRAMANGTPVMVRLTHYPRADAADLPPLVMIHGYSVSGNTFTHPSLEPSAAAWFWRGDLQSGRRGREIWILDLRTSTGMPTATQPWAMEQPALIDIPAALLHIRNATGRRVDVFAHCIGCVMLSMALLTDARRVRNDDQQLGPDTRLTSEHLGLLTAFNRPDPQGGPHPCIERVVLSQKGPVLRYSDANLLRAYLMQYVRRWLMNDAYDFRPPRKPTVGDELLDRLLSSLPYPDADYDIENPLWPCARTPWTATRHRMDALYGRDFNADNMSPAALAAIDDLFGPMHLDTVAQTIHFARFNAITNQRGRGEFVTFGQLRKRWSGMPTLAIHGKDNGLVDVTTQSLLRDHMDGTGVPFECETFEHMGHQDCLIGRQSTRVFERIGRFLDKPLPSMPAATSELKTISVIDLPWVGPRLAAPLPDQTRQMPLGVASLSRPDQGCARHLLWPALREGGEIKLQAWPDCVVVAPDAEPSSKWVRLNLISAKLQAMETRAGNRLNDAGWLLLHLYEKDETTATSIEWLVHIDPKILMEHWPQDRKDVAPRLALTAAAMPQRFDPRLNQAFVALTDALHADRSARLTKPAPRLTLALGSCQYPTGLLDTKIAEQSLKRLDGTLKDIDLVLFVGDQIYADATAGLADPVRRDERFDQPHERALRVPPIREVVRKRLVRTLPDDHELSDNWEPMNDAVTKRRPREAKANEQSGTQGFKAWRKHQSTHGDSRPGANQVFDFAGHPFFLLDTRTLRSPRGTTVRPLDAHLIDLRQRRKLMIWLLRNRDRVKFIASPSLLLPPNRATAQELKHPNRRGQHAVNDGWDGYPTTLAWLLEFLVTHRIGRTVFLSGDEHHALWCNAALKATPGGLATQVVSIHGSALYAPYPFANGLPQHLLDTGTVRVGNVDVHLQTCFAPPGDGFVRVELDSGGVTPLLKIRFEKADGSWTEHTVPLL
jgi:cholesterol oxidase